MDEEGVTIQHSVTYYKIEMLRQVDDNAFCKLECMERFPQWIQGQSRTPSKRIHRTSEGSANQKRLIYQPISLQVKN